MSIDSAEGCIWFEVSDLCEDLSLTLDLEFALGDVSEEVFESVA